MDPQAPIQRAMKFSSVSRVWLVNPKTGRFADDGQEGGRPTSPGSCNLPDRRRAERLRPLFQFIKVSMLKSNGQKTQEIEVRKKAILKLILSPESE